MKRKSGFRRKRKTDQQLPVVGLRSRNFSAVEDNPHAFLILKKIASKAAKNAAAEARVAGLPYTFARNAEVVRVTIDGKEEVISTARSENMKSGSFYITYSPATIIHARRK